MTMNEIKGEFNRLSVQEAFEIGGVSDRVTFTTGPSVPRTFTAGAGKFLRVLATADCYLNLAQPTVVVADDPGVDNYSIFCPLGETLFLTIPDMSQDAVLSVIGVSDGGELYASIVK